MPAIVAPRRTSTEIRRAVTGFTASQCCTTEARWPTAAHIIGAGEMLTPPTVRIGVLLVCATGVGFAALDVSRATQSSPGITTVPGILVGHHTLKERPTGCTVILA